MFRFYFNSFRGLPRAGVLLSLAALINRLGSVVLFFFAIYLTKNNWSVFDIGKVLSAYSFGYAGGAYLGGRLSDRYDSRFILIITLMGSGLCFFGLSIADSFTPVILLLSMAGILEGAFKPAYNVTMTRCCTQDEWSRAYALYMTTTYLGGAIASMAGGFLSKWNFSYIFYFDGVTCIIAAVFVCIVFDRLTRSVEAEKEQITDEFSLSKNTPPSSLVIWIIFVSMFFVYLVDQQESGSYMIHITKQYGIDTHQVGMLIAFGCVLMALTTVPLTQFFKRIPDFIAMTLGSLILCLSFGLLNQGDSFAFLFLLMAMWSLGSIISFPTVVSLIGKYSTKERVGHNMGIYHFISGLSRIVAPSLGTYVYQNLGPNILWSACTAIGVFSGVSFLLIYRFSLRSIHSREA